MISSLRRTASYLRLYRNRIFVIAIDGGLLNDDGSASALLEQVALLHLLGIRIVLLPGGAILPIRVLELCRHKGVEAVADLASEDHAVLGKTLEAGLMPVACDPAAAAASALHARAVAIGSAMRAEKLIFCTEVPGVLERPGDPHSLVSYTDLAGLERLQRAGCFERLPVPAAAAIATAIRSGVRRVHVISGRTRDALLVEVFTNEGTGTMIVQDASAIPSAEQRVDSAVA
jgi:acetylglutamate kinase